MESYEKEWLAGQPLLLAILPMSACSTARRAGLPHGVARRAGDPGAHR